MAFKKAESGQSRLKIGFYGPPGSGKTFTALLLAEGLASLDGKRVAYVDTERGTDFYSKPVPARPIHPDAFDFDALYTRSLAAVTEDIHALDPATHGVIVIDSITHLWDAAIDAFSGKKTKIDSIPMSAWGSIKKPYKALVRYLLDAPYHVIICGRQKNVFDTVDGEMVKVGVGMRAEGETEYEPHICVRMEVKRGDPTVYATFEKDRTGILANRTMPNPTFETFRPMLSLLGGEQAQSEDPDEVAARDSELLSRDGDKARAKEAKSEDLYAKHAAAISAATTMDDLMAVAATLKRDRRYLIDGHEEGLRILYQQRHGAIANALAPAGV